ncbi:MAG: metalloregulator ArsR/SmtB family transcription factor [Phycisphaerales bacterium]|nr:metalloregulator ArsR/SmtB family transcription factor [Phycisphaerales bacterium]
MTQVRTRPRPVRQPVRPPATPRQAARCCQPIDDLLDPELFKALSDPTRVKLLGCIAKCGRACTVGEVAECCSVDLSVVSRHLRQLEQAGVLESQKDGRSVSYIVRYAHIAQTMRDLARAIDDCRPRGDGANPSGVCCAPK